MKYFEIVIAGAGPAGIAAAIAASKRSDSVALLDDNLTLGGQIWRGHVPEPWRSRFPKRGIEFFSNTRIIDANQAEKLLTAESTSAFDLQYSKLILATGARELFLPFPGWTLPNVFGAGGLQALAKSGFAVEGKRVIMAGSGPLLLPVAAYLKKHGARVPVIAEQATWPRLIGFAGSLLFHPNKLGEALYLKSQTLGVNYHANSWVSEATGVGKVEWVKILQNGKLREERADLLAVAYGFTPNTELARLLGCKLNHGLVAVNRYQQTSIPDIYCAGEPTGIGGVDKSLLEGNIAGLAATGQFPSYGRTSIQNFSQKLNTTFALRSELRSLPRKNTLICRCEDVPFHRLQNCRSWREAKLHHRCGMGPCQGRICGPITEFLFGWKQESIRPPLFPSAIQSLMTIRETTHL